MKRPEGGAAAAAMVRLVGEREDVCSDAALLVDRTDASGVARLATEWCGPARVIAVADGARGEIALDTCEAAAVTVQLRAQPESSAAGDGGGVAEALAFAQALAAGDWDAAEALLAPGQSIEPYREAGGGLVRASSASFSRVPPSAIWSAEREGGGERARVLLGLAYDDGCQRRAAVELARTDEGWRVSALGFDGAAP